MTASKTIFLAAMGLCALFLGACEKEAVETPEVVRPVRILTVAGLEAGATLSYPGEIQGAQNAELAFEVAGRLIELPAEEGIDVTQNQLLARLDPADYQSALDAARGRSTSPQKIPSIAIPKSLSAAPSRGRNSTTPSDKSTSNKRNSHQRRKR